MKRLLFTIAIALCATVSKAQIDQISITNSTGIPSLEAVFHGDNSTPPSCLTPCATPPYRYLPTMGSLNLTASDPAIWHMSPTPVPFAFTLIHLHEAPSNSGFIYPCSWTSSGTYPFTLGTTTYNAVVNISGTTAIIDLQP